MLNELMRKFVRFIDPKLEPYRTSSRSTRSTTHQQPAHSESAFASGPTIQSSHKFSFGTTPPETLEEFIDLIKRIPKSVLSSKDRSRIAAVMSFNDRTVRDLMVPKRDMVFVKDTDILGPLVLDKLYKSGFTKFPVMNHKGEVLGIIHTEALNALEIKKTDRATKYLDKNVNYLHASDSLRFAISEMERTNGCYFLVLDGEDHLTGSFTIEMLLDYLIQ